MPHRADPGSLPFAAAGALAGALLAGPRSRGSRRVAAAVAGGLAGLAAWMLVARRRRSGPLPRPGPVTQALVTRSPADTPIGPPGANLEQRLDEAIHETFPASDPISLHIE